MIYKGLVFGVDIAWTCATPPACWPGKRTDDYEIAGKFITAAALVWAGSLGLVAHGTEDDRDRGGSERYLNARLAQVLRQEGFTGRIESTLEDRLGRRHRPAARQPRPAAVVRQGSFAAPGQHVRRMPFADRTALATRSRLPSASTTTASSVRTGTGPRNQRRSPLVVNTAFYPKLMWNGRFFANRRAGQDARRSVQQQFSGSRSRRPRRQSLSYHDHLLQAQAFIPPTELVEVAGFTGTSDTDLSPDFEPVRQRPGAAGSAAG